MSQSQANQSIIENGLAQVELPLCGARVWDEHSLQAFHEAIQSLLLEASVRGLVIAGESGAAFCRGVDIGLLGDGSKVAGAALNRAFAQAFTSLRRFPGVSAAALTGEATDAGLECALCCDFRIAEPGIRLTLSPARYGLVPNAGGSQLLVRLVGEVWAKRMLLCGESVDAQTALRIGLVDAISEPGQARSLAADWVRRSFRQGPQAVRATKQLIEHARMRPLETGFAAERDWMVELQGADEQIEGIAADLEGRAPSWQGDR